MKKTFLNRFEEPGDGNEPSPAGGSGGSTAGYTYEQLEEVANARAERASRAALADFFRKQGMTETQVTEAIEGYKKQKKENEPNISALEAERDKYKKEAETFRNKETLAKKNVLAEFVDFVQFEANKLVTDKVTFDEAADQFLKDHPKYASTSASTGMRVNTTPPGGSSSAGESANSEINKIIRGAMKR